MSRRAIHRSLSIATFPIIAALFGGLGQYQYAPGDDGGAGAGGGKPNDPPPKTESKKIELTEDELNGRITAATEAAVKAAENKAAAAAKKKADDDAAKLAKEQGDFKKLYDGEVELKKQAERERDEARIAVRAKDIDIALGRYLAKNHKDYVDAAEWIRPHVKVEADADDAAVEKSIKATVDQYVKDNPRAGGTPKANIPSAIRGGKLSSQGGGAGDVKELIKENAPPRRPFDYLSKNF